MSRVSGAQKKSHGGKLTTKHAKTPLDRQIVLQTILEKVCNRGEIVAFEKKMLSNPPPTECQHIEHLLVLYLGKCFEVPTVIGVSRLGEVLKKAKAKDRELFIALVCRLAFIKSTGHNPDNIELSNVLLQQGLEAITSSNTHHLIDFGTLLDGPYSSSNSYSFVDRTIQKFLTAVYLCHQPIMTTIDFIKQYIFCQSSEDSVIAKDCGEVLQYLFGLVGSGLGQCLNEVLPHLLHYTCQFVVTNDPVVDNPTALLVLACLRQAQNPPLCLKVHYEFFKRQILSYKLIDLQLDDISFYLASTTESHQAWTIYYNDETMKPSLVELITSIKHKYSVNVNTRHYAALTRYETGRVTISNRNSDHLLSVMGQSRLVGRDESFTALQEGAISPGPSSPFPSVYGYLRNEQYENMKTYENITYFNLVKDVLMPPLQLYSTLPMQAQYRKGDHIWLMGSQNIRHDFYKNVMLSPLSPMHWVKVKQPDGTQELEDRYEKLALDQLRSQSIDTETSEIVLLNSHRFCQIAVTPPTGTEPTIISLYGNSEEMEEPGYIGSDYLVTAHEATGDVRWKESRQFDVIRDERIGRELPLPSKRGTDSGDMTAITATTQVLEESSRFQKSTSPRPQTSYQQQYNKSTSSAIRPLGEPPANEQQIKRLALESFDIPGQCFFGEGVKFVTNRVYTQPQLLPGTRVLREGGNGLILEVYFEGEVYAVKRTAFRWREVLIMPKLRHKNILRLIAMLMGPAMEGYPRRRYVFHYYPKMTNDLGRLIGSYEKYCLRTLKDRYKNERLLLNKIHSNFRYIANELLQGLHYLHTSPNPIVHRDVKPSNILVLTGCDCPNPLACVCRVRPQIVLSDFDASLELNHDCTLQADPPRSLTQGLYLSSDRTYHISPVGTIGFKSPEGFIHMIGNSSDVMPCLSIKADIFSFGLVMLLLVLAEEGPRSMAKIGILLLSLNKQSTSGSSSLSSLVVTDNDIDKVLPLKRLKREFSSSIPSLVDFVSIALSIDPRKRASADKLLSHAYLNEPF